MLPDPPIAHVEVDLYLHVRVLISIILGLSVTRLLGGLAQFMQQSDRPRLSWIHLAWVAWVLLNVVSFWWWEFRLSHVAHWTFALYLFVIAYASTFFLQAALLFPADIADTRATATTSWRGAPGSSALSPRPRRWTWSTR